MEAKDFNNNPVTDEEYVIYDATDDFDESEVRLEGDGPFRLMDNKEIFTYEYMDRIAEEFDADNTRRKRIDRIVPVCVIAGIVVFIAVLCLICFKFVFL